MNILEVISQSLANLSTAEGAVARKILESPETTTRLSTAELANLAAVSPPTIGRLAKTLGCKGFPDLKLQLAASLANRSQFSSAAIDGSSDDEIVNGLVQQVRADLSAFQLSTNSVNLSTIEAAINSASRIEFYGIGASAAVAADAQHRFFRMGLSAVYYEDIIKQRMAAVAASKDVVVFVFSFTGQTELSVEVARLAKEAGATVIGVTRENSELARLVDYNLPLRSSENTELVTPMSSRLLMLLWVDVLATAVFRLRGDEAQDTYQRVKENLQVTRIAKKGKRK